MNDFNQWAQQPPAGPTTPVVNVSNNTEGSDTVVVTFKAGTGYDAPWVVFHAGSNAEAADLMGAAEATGLLALIAQTDKAFKAHFLVGRELGAVPVQSPAAAEQQFYQQPQAQAPQAPAQDPWANPGGQPQAQPQQQYGQASQPPPGAQAPSCPHGVKKWVAGTGAKGAYKFWGCPAPKGDPSQCKPQWVN